MLSQSGVAFGSPDRHDPDLVHQTFIPAVKSPRLPPLLTRLIWTASQVKEDAGGADISHIPDALKEFGAMAQWGVPAHGTFVATQPDVEVIIGRAAKPRFGSGDAKREFDEASASSRTPTNETRSKRR